MRVLKIYSDTLSATYPNAVPIRIAFDPKEFKDSEALRNALCQYDLGDNYIVSFSDIRDANEE